MCRLRAFVRNGVMLRSEQNYDHDRCGDLYGNKATKAWNPRGCPKGYTMQRRVYGPYRLKGPGACARAGRSGPTPASRRSPTSPQLRTKYKFDDRGNDTFVRVTWDEAYQVPRRRARGRRAAPTAATRGGRGWTKDGYDPLMIDQVQGAGTRTIKVGSNLPIHGVIGKFGIYRLANLLGLLDHHVRGVPAEQARGARDWNEYTWRGDQAPGHPFVHGLQTSDMDMNDLRFSKLVIQVGKNLIENKMPESHWLNEVMERGGKLVDIAPEYNCPGTKSNYWIGVRPGLSDTAVFLGVTKILIDEDWYDADFVRRFTDFPLLVRTDTLKRLRPEEVDRGLQAQGPQGRAVVQDPGADRRAAGEDRRLLRLGRQGRQGRRRISRDEVGAKCRSSPRSKARSRSRCSTAQTVEVMPIFEMYKRHLADYDLKTVEEISGAPAALVRRLAEDIWKTTKAGQPVAIHIGEGINHYFHATLHNRATYLPMHPDGQHRQARRRRIHLGRQLQGGPASGFLVERARGRLLHRTKTRSTPCWTRRRGSPTSTCATLNDGEDPSYWACGEKIAGRRDPRRPQGLHRQDPPAHADQGPLVQQRQLPQPGQVGLQHHRQRPAEDGPDRRPADRVDRLGRVRRRRAAGQLVGRVPGLRDAAPRARTRSSRSGRAASSRSTTRATTARSSPAWPGRWPSRPATGGSPTTSSSSPRRRPRSTSSACWTTARPPAGTDGPYEVDRLMAGEYGGEPGAALMLFRTYPRVPFWEQVHDSIPFYTDSGRLASYCDLPEAIEYGENLVVHREAVEATPYLPNVDRLDQPVRPAQGLRHPARHDRPRPAPGAQRQDALGRGQEDGQPALGAGLPLLLLDAQEPALDPLVVVHGRLALDLERQLRRPVPGRQAGAGRRRPADPDEPRGGRRAGPERGGLRLCRCQPARPALRRLGQGHGLPRTRRSAAWCGSCSTRACPTTSRS